MIEIKDNFLDKKEFNELQSFLVGPTFPWFYLPVIDFAEDRKDKDKFQFIHLFYDNHLPVSSAIENLHPLITKIFPCLLWRIKANLLTKKPTIIENEFHIDIGLPDKGQNLQLQKKLGQLTTSIFYVNSNNGYTKFADGKKVESVANRMISFPSNMRHKGTSCTDEKVRIVINFNYLKLL